MSSVLALCFLAMDLATTFLVLPLSGTEIPQPLAHCPRPVSHVPLAFPCSTASPQRWSGPTEPPLAETCITAVMSSTCVAQYTGPVPSEQDSVMVQSEAPPQSLAPPLSPPTQRPSSCCFCWCCCCSCSWYGLPPRQACCRSEEERRVRRKRWETKLETLSNCEACSKPSAEEMRLWAESFECLMRNPAGRNLFREFLRTEYSEDNMLFWLACEDLRQEHSKTAILDKAQLIYENYVSILSPKEVSLDSRVREVINQRMQDPTAHTFDEAQLQIYTLMHRDSYPRFLSSSVYRSLLRNGSCSSSLS